MPKWIELNFDVITTDDSYFVLYVALDWHEKRDSAPGGLRTCGIPTLVDALLF